ncbi:hypothetical protein ColTof4_02008 [Colletotrichum tofieldiae]|nr:hypothetical protein ColTof3_09707 [Colletotrichum tofieldiae]GKT69585.1 hypothetical protein ColTof4_02008 [Colletotrichum tofieldiae]
MCLPVCVGRCTGTGTGTGARLLDEKLDMRLQWCVDGWVPEVWKAATDAAKGDSRVEEASSPGPKEKKPST